MKKTNQRNWWKLGISVAIFVGGVALTGGLVTLRKTKVNEVDFGELEEVEVAKVFDGDTIELTDGRRVRYTGINTPEMGWDDCYAVQARWANYNLVQGQVVRLEKDVREADVYGRLLRYIYVGEVMVNELLVRDGWAKIATYPPDVKYAEVFRQAEDEARKKEVGLWGKCEI